MYAFFNRILKVDLDNSSFEIEEIPDRVLKRGLGGKGLATYLLLKFNPPGVDPLSPQNHLVFATGPVTGTHIYGSCRFGVYSKSPLTGFYAESYSGGWVPEAISRTGFDAVVISGAARDPMVLEITEKGAVFHTADDLWGADTYHTGEEMVRRWATRKQGMEKSGAVVIGPAGEKQVRFSVIENDKWRSAGRTGMGAVMGSKCLKGVLFNGAQKRELADPEALARFVQKTKEQGKTDKGVSAYKSLGTPMMVDVLNKAGGFPTQYWAKGKFENWEKINAGAMQEKCKVRSHACLRCMMACGKVSTVKSGRHAGLTIEGPEYETIYAFGGLCMIQEIEEIAYLNDICDRLGMDTITAGNLCAFAMEASKRGRIKEKLEYGNADHAAWLLNMIATREGIGGVLAEGIIPASQAFDLEELAVHVKGMEPAGYDPRLLKGVGLGYAVSDRGACHLRATFYKPELAGISPPDQMEGKAEVFIDYEDRLNIFDTLILCRFYRDLYPWEELQEMIRCTTGLDLNPEELRSLSARVMNDTRRFNIQEGLTAKDDTLPKRFFEEPLESGEKITKEQFVQMRSDYYRLRGWDEQGRPSDSPTDG